MADHKVRHSAWEPLTLLAECGINPRLVTPGPDGWHSAESVAKWIADQLNASAAKRGITPKPDAGTTSGSALTVQAAYDTGRITATSRPEWERRYATDPQSVGEVLAGLAPVVSAEYRATPKTAADELDEINDLLYGPGHSEASRQRLLASEDEQALAGYRAAEQAERDAAGQTISADEWRQIYGTEPPEGL